MTGGADTEQLWGQMHERLLSYIRRRVATPEDAEDILQDVFVRIHASLPSLRDSESVLAWTYQIARNAITDYYRKRAADSRALAELAEEARQADRVAENGIKPDVTRQAAEEFAGCLEPLLGEVPEPYRQAIRLTELEGLRQKDAAGQLGLSVPGMKARVQRGRSKFKDVILDCCSVEFDRRGGLVDYERRRSAPCNDCDCR